MTLLDACREVMSDKEVTGRYPLGLDGRDVLTEIRRKHGDDAFPLVSVLDVIDEMRSLGSVVANVMLRQLREAAGLPNVAMGITPQELWRQTLTAVSDLAQGQSNQP